MIKITLELKMKSSIISRFAVVTGLVVGSALGLATVGLAVEGATESLPELNVFSSGAILTVSNR